MYFADNKTYTGEFSAYGGHRGLGGGVEADGSAGTIFFYHTGQLHMYSRLLYSALILRGQLFTVIQIGNICGV